MKLFRHFRLIRLIGPIGLILYFGLQVRAPAHALVCGEDIPGNAPPGVLNDYIKDCQNKISDNQGTQRTLSAAISYLNNQISLTQAQIYSTQSELNILNNEIADLSGKIESLDYSLTDLTKLFVARVRRTYMFQSDSPATVIAATSGIPDLLRNLEYAKRVRNHDRELLIALEKSRLDFNTQKTQKEALQAQVEATKRKLDSQKADLNTQVASKNQLLADTKNSEAQYQKLLATATRQLAAFSRFVSNQGGASILSGTTKTDSGWGTYYNQRDSQWGNQLLPGSSYSMASSGCLVTSMAMVMSYYGKNVTPGSVASQSELFTFGLLKQGSLSIGGNSVTRTRIGSSQSDLDSELGAGKPVILGVSPYGSSDPEHFIVVKKKDGDDYIINDPFIYPGMGIKFKDHYSLSAIRVVDRVSVN